MEPREWIWGYFRRVAMYVGGTWGFGVFTGQWKNIEEFFQNNPAIGIIALIIDFSLYMIRMLAEYDEVRLGRRVRKAAKKIRGGEGDE